jgi:hypothetical protein
LNVAFVGFKPALVAVFWLALPFDDAETDVLACPCAFTDPCALTAVDEDPDVAVFVDTDAVTSCFFCCPGALAELPCAGGVADAPPFPFPLPASAGPVKAIRPIDSAMAPTAAVVLNMLLSSCSTGFSAVPLPFAKREEGESRYGRAAV